MKIRVTSKQYRIISYFYRFGGFTIIIGLLLGYSFLIGKPIEFLCVFLPYFITKNFYSKQYHSNSLKHCFIISLITFGIAITFAVPKEMSVMFSFFLGFIIAFISYKIGIIQFKLKDYAYIEPRYNQLVDFYNENILHKSFNVNNCTKDELLDRCSKLHLSKENTELAVAFFINKTKQSIIADKLCIDEKSVTMKKMRLKQKLNNN